MSGPVLIDTGVLVAAFRSKEAAHAAARRALGSVPTPLFTTWPVLTETFHLLRKEPGAVPKVIALVRAGTVAVEPVGPDFLDWYEKFAAVYSDRQVDLADASLVRIAERLGAETVLTLDRNDFAVYRIDGKTAFRILPEAGESA